MRHLLQDVENNSLWNCKNKMIGTSCPLLKKQETELLKNQAAYRILEIRRKLAEISSCSAKEPAFVTLLRRLLCRLLLLLLIRIKARLKERFQHLNNIPSTKVEQMLFNVRGKN